MTLKPLFLSLPLLGLTLGCDSFDAAPKVSLDGVVQTTMTTDPGEPLVLRFSEPVKPGSVDVTLHELQPGDLDGEGNLPDEASYRAPTGESQAERKERFLASALAAFDGRAPEDYERTFPEEAWTFSADARSLTLVPERTPSVSTPYLFLIAPGLSDRAGLRTKPRQRIPFSYPLVGGGPTTLPSGYYFFIINIDFLSQQLHVFAHLEVDPVTGIWRGVFTDANRVEQTNSRPECGTCPPNLPMCQLHNPNLPRCVVPSEKMSALAEFPDFLPVAEPPIGYDFRVGGVARDETDGSIAWGTVTFDINIVIGTGNVRVTTENTKIHATFRKQAYAGAERFVGTGNASVKNVKINGLGGADKPAKGEVSAMSLTAEEVAQINGFGLPIPTL